MKKSAKILFGIFCTSIFIYFSCASKPKTEPIVSDDLQEQADISSTTSDSETPETEESIFVQENKTETDLSDLEEALTEEQNPELPALPEEKETGLAKEEVPEEPELSPEPPVRDEPIVVQEVDADIKKDTEEIPAEKNTAASDSYSTEEVLNEIKDTKGSSPEEPSIEVEKKDDSAETEVQIEPGKVSVMPNPSRSITIQKNQFIDIIYPGKGWIYQGNIDEEGLIDTKNRNFVFGGRKLGGKDTAFTLRSRNSGTFILHFFKNDTLTGNYIDDYLEVIVQNKTINSTEHIVVPDYASIVPPQASITAEKIKEEQKQKKIQEELNRKTEEETKKISEKPTSAPAKNQQPQSGTIDSSIDTVIQTTESAPGANAPSVKTERKTEKKEEQKKSSSPAKEMAESEDANLENKTAEQLLESAQKHYDKKEYPMAYSAITKFFDKASSRLDEGLYLQGQILEEKSPVQNIKDAIESYDLVVKNYPSSSLWDKANKRSIFLKRFYINIR